MVTTTTLLCSKFSPHCIQIIDSLRKQNISLEPFIKLVWIDNPTVRSYLQQTQVKSVPCIVVHDEDRDISIIYEKHRFTDYLNNFIQQRQARIPPPPAAPHSSMPPPPLPPQAPHLAAMANNTAFQTQHQQFTAQQQNFHQTMQKSQADLALHQVQNIQQIPSNQTIRNNLSKSIFGTEQPPKAPMSNGMQAMGEQLLADVKRQSEELQQKAIRDHAGQKEAALKQVELNGQLSRQQYQQNRQLMKEEVERKVQEQDQLGLMSLMTELKKYPEFSSLSDADLKTVAQQKALSHEIDKLETAQQQLNNLRQLHGASPEKLIEIDKQLSIMNQTKLSLLQKRMNLPQLSAPNKLLPVGIQNHTSAVDLAQKENYVQLQQEKLESDLGVAKKTLQKNGTTSLDDLLGNEETLFDHYSKSKGTDVRQTEQHVNTALSSSKRNSINQRVREMSQTRPVQVEMGSGHEAMAQSSLVTLPEKKNTFTPIDDIIDSGDEILEDEPSGEQVVSSAVKKKKSTALDMAREMEKSRGLLDKQFEQSRGL